MKHRPPEPPIPQSAGFPLTYLAARPSRARRVIRQIGAAGWISAAAVLGIAATAVLFEIQTNRAQSAADHAAVVAKPTARPGTPVPQKPTEYAPPRPGQALPGDGQWIVGKDIEPGLYRSESGFLCYWERLSGLSGTYVDLIDNGGFRKGQLYVTVEAGDFAFTSQGCTKWERIR